MARVAKTPEQYEKELQLLLEEVYDYEKAEEVLENTVELLERHVIKAKEELHVTKQTLTEQIVRSEDARKSLQEQVEELTRKLEAAEKRASHSSDMEDAVKRLEGQKWTLSRTAARTAMEYRECQLDLSQCMVAIENLRTEGPSLATALPLRLPREPDWPRLPTELLTAIFRKLPLPDLLEVSVICRGWRACVFGHGMREVWSNIIERVKFTDVSLRLIPPEILRTARRLEVNSTKCTDRALKHIGAKLDATCSLTHLNVGCLRAITDRGLQLLLEKGMGRKLRVLNLASCQHITDHGLETIGHECRPLEALDLYECSHIGDPGLQFLSNGCHSLRDLTLVGCVKITDAGLQHLGRGCTSLTHLDLYRCSLVTDAGIEKLAAGCPQISNLELGAVNQLTDRALGALARLPRLLQLDLSKCVNLTDEGLLLLAEGCPLLQTLNLGGLKDTGKVTQRSLEKFPPHSVQFR